MNRITSVILIIPIYFVCMLFLLSMLVVKQESESLEKLRLTKAINYSTDAATAEMLGAGHLGMDYVDKNKMTVDPQEALDTFVQVFALNYDLSLGQENLEMIKNSYMPIFVVAAYDGYYVFENRRVNREGDFNLVSTPKLPYRYKAPDGTLYALNMGLENSIKFDGGSLSKVPMPISEAEAMRVINSRISDDMLYRLDQSYAQGFESTFYIPHSMTTISHTNAISGPSVLAFINNLNLTTRNKLSEFSIGGAQVEQARMVAAYRRNGENYYAYADLLPEGVDIVEMFTNVMDAAKAGFHHDSFYMN